MLSTRVIEETFFVEAVVTHYLANVLETGFIFTVCGRVLAIGNLTSGVDAAIHPVFARLARR